MNFLFDFTQPRTAGRAVLFYLGHLVFVIVSAGALGMAAAGHAEAGSVQSVAGAAGELVATVYPVVLCVLVVMQRELAPINYGLAVVVLPLAYLFGGVGGLIIPAYLATRGRTTDGTILAPAATSRKFAPRKPGEPFGRRLLGH